MKGVPVMQQLVWIAVGLSAVAAMSGCSGPAEPANASFPPNALLTMKSKTGDLSIEVRTSPQPPVRGTNLVEFTVKDTVDGSPRAGLSIAMTPWMPSMNHGSSAIPTATPETGGKYLVTDVDLFMPGLWELRTSFSGPAKDYVAPAFVIP